MNGFLSPEGIMYECSFYEHSKLATELKDAFLKDGKYRFDWTINDDNEALQKWGFIYFGYTGDLGTNTDSYIFLDFDTMIVTDEQKEWIELNKSKITDKQYNEFCDIIAEKL